MAAKRRRRFGRIGASACGWFPDSKRIAFMRVGVGPTFDRPVAQAPRQEGRTRRATVKANVLSEANIAWVIWLTRRARATRARADVSTRRTRESLAAAGIACSSEPSRALRHSPEGRTWQVTVDIAPRAEDDERKDHRRVGLAPAGIDEDRGPAGIPRCQTRDIFDGHHGRLRTRHKVQENVST